MDSKASLKTLRRLWKLADLLGTPDYWNIQQLALELGVSERTVRYDMDTLEALGCPLQFSKTHGWQLTQKWDFWTALKSYFSQE
jgi:biotin operon repressor